MRKPRRIWAGRSKLDADEYTHKAESQRKQSNGQDPADFAGRLRSLRRQKNLSQTELVDVYYTHISRYERGLSCPSADTLKRLADALDVSGDYDAGSDR